jgi:hypothetical protein
VKPVKWPTFGNTLRAARLGFHWHEGMQAMMRVGAEGPPWRIELCPADQIPSRPQGELHRIWWDKPFEDPAKYSPVLNRIKAVHRPIVIYLGDDGQRVERVA